MQSLLSFREKTGHLFFKAGETLTSDQEFVKALNKPNRIVWIGSNILDFDQFLGFRPLARHSKQFVHVFVVE
jgi:hypothetical protein